MDVVLMSNQYVGFLQEEDKIYAHNYSGQGKVFSQDSDIHKSSTSLALIPAQGIRSHMDTHETDPHIHEPEIRELLDEVRAVWRHLGIPLHSKKRRYFTTPLVIKDHRGITLDKIQEDDQIILEHYAEGDFGYNRQTLRIQDKARSRNNISLMSLRSRLMDPHCAVIRIDRDEPRLDFEKNSIARDKGTGKLYLRTDPYFIYCLEAHELVFAGDKELEEVVPVPLETGIQEQLNL